MKEKKVSISHFQNHRLNFVDENYLQIRPIYFRIRYNGKHTELRSICFDDLIKAEYSDLTKTISKSVLNHFQQEVVRIDLQVINEIVNDLRSSKAFDLKKFKEIYLTKGENVLNFFRKEEMDLAKAFLRKLELRELENIMDNGQHKLRSLERLLKEIDVVLELEYPQSLSKKYMDSVYFLRVFEAEISKYLKTYPNYLPLYLWEKNNDIVIDQAEEVAELQSVVSYHENLIDLEKKEYYKSYFIRFNDRVMNKRSK